MKKSMLFLFVILPSVLIAQTVKYQINGKIGVSQNQYYAYLYAKNALEKIKIQNGEFKFSGQAEIGTNLMVSGFLFIDKRANITAEEITAVKQHPTILKDKYNSFRLVLENMTIYIANPEKTDTLKFEAGGVLNKILLESYTYLKNRKFLDFFSKYPDSPVSASLLNLAVKLRKTPMRKQENAERYRVKEAYDLLSEKLKETTYVKQLKLEIDKL
jgi:hypothetical protein